MNTLILVAHPDLDNSRINKAWIKACNTEPSLTVHDLYALYGESSRIDIAREQALLLTHTNIVFQFPFYWFSTPPLLKKWFDEVLLPGFAYGHTPAERKLGGKQFGLAVSAGIRAADYHPEGRYRYTMETLLSPLRVMISYIDGVNVPPFIFYGAEHSPAQTEIDASAKDYLHYLHTLQLRQRPKEKHPEIVYRVAKIGQIRLACLTDLHRARGHFTPEDARDLATIENAALIGLHVMGHGENPIEMERLYRTFIRLLSPQATQNRTPGTRAE